MGTASKEAVDGTIERYLRGSGEPIKNQADLEAIPGYETQIEFGGKTGRSLKDMLIDYALAKIDEVPCGIQGCRKKHMYGYLVVTSDGRITNIGQDCGRNHLGLNYSSTRKSYKARRKAISNRQAIAEARAELSKHSAKIERVRSLSGALSRCRNVIREWMPIQAGELITMAAERNSSIMVERLMDKREAQIHFIQTNTSRKDYVGGKPMVSEVVGTLAGVAFFRSSLSSFVARKISPAIDEVISLSDSDIEEMTPEYIAQLAKRLGDAIRNISEAEKIAEQGVRFFTPDNVSKLTLMGASEENVRKLSGPLSELAALDAQ
tara:strand:- start:15824 stop:16786 length:963 start_codon:yes stop_codon:yes gene_type:complete